MIKNSTGSTSFDRQKKFKWDQGKGKYYQQRLCRIIYSFQKCSVFNRIYNIRLNERLLSPGQSRSCTPNYCINQLIAITQAIWKQLIVIHPSKLDQCF